MDAAREWTDEQLKEMERRIKRIYQQAQGEITEKWRAYMAESQSRLSAMYNAMMTAPPEYREEMMRRYQEMVQNETLRSQWYRDMVNETTYRLYHTNEMAMAYINGKMPDIYAVNFNYIDPDALGLGIDFTLVDEGTLKQLIVDGYIPQKIINPIKDMSWNTRQIGSSVLQSILQGESIPQMAKRIYPVVDNNKKAAIRNARTMTTAAENKGRLNRYEDYAAKGLLVTKVWMATGDDRTRDWHLSMDGQEREIDEPFIDGLGNELMEPGDPDAPSNTVWNCRCSMRSRIKGVKNNGKTTPIKNMHRSGLHQQQIEEERGRRK